MILRIRLRRGRPIQRKAGKNRHVALALGSLLTPVALMAYVLGLWRVASDMGIAGEFGITGVFSHWQIWISAGVLIHAAGISLTRYGRGGEMLDPRALVPHLFPLHPPVPPKERGAEEALHSRVSVKLRR
jgi:hypothetical protein